MVKKAHLSGIAFAAIFGFSFMSSKTVLGHVSPMGLLAYRFMIAFLFIEGLRRVKLIDVKLSKHTWRAASWVILLQPGLYFVFETLGLARMASVEAGIMIALIPVFTALFGTWLLKERPHRKQLVFIAMSVLGIWVVQMASRQALSFDRLGFGLLLGAVMAAALFNIASRVASRTIEPLALTYCMMASGAVLFNAVHTVERLHAGTLRLYFQPLTSFTVLLPVLYLGVMSSVIAFFLVNTALKHLEAHVISIYANLATVIAMAAGVIFLQEQLNLIHILGALCILLGVYGTVYYSRHKPMTPIMDTSIIEKGGVAVEEAV
ncbi:MAG: DMT family transporter [Acholeplasmatales bacterium]|nr:MAG: DMT family transporter [Acholeplasmatales bacterium]